MASVQWNHHFAASASRIKNHSIAPAATIDLPSVAIARTSVAPTGMAPTGMAMTSAAASGSHSRERPRTKQRQRQKYYRYAGEQQVAAATERDSQGASHRNTGNNVMRTKDPSQEGSESRTASTPVKFYERTNFT